MIDCQVAARHLKQAFREDADRRLGGTHAFHFFGQPAKPLRDIKADAGTAATDFESAVRAVDARYRSGLGSLFELEDARRSALAAQILLIDLRRDRTAAWIALYRALGGGWTAPAETPTLLTGAPAQTTP